MMMMMVPVWNWGSSLEAHNRRYYLEKKIENGKLYLNKYIPILSMIAFIMIVWLALCCL